MLSDYKTDYGWEDMLTQAKKDLADYETRLSEAKSDKASAEAAIVDGNKLTGYPIRLLLKFLVLPQFLNKCYYRGSRYGFLHLPLEHQRRSPGKEI